MNSGKKVLGWVILIVVVVVIIFSFNKGGTSNDTSPIKFGFIGPISGDAAAYGEPVKNGIQLAINQINAKGGINGRQIEIIYEDGKCSGKDASGAAQKLVGVDGVKYIVGGVCSGEVFAFAPITSAAKTMVILSGASAPKLSGISPYIIRNNPNDNVTGTELADFVAKSYKTTAIISEQTDYSQGLKEVFQAQIAKNGLTSVAAEDYATNATDFRSLLLKIKTAKPDVVFVNPQTPANLVRIVKQARQLGINYPVVSTAFGSAPEVLGAGAVFEGAVFADAPGLSSVGKGAQFTTDYKNAYGSEPTFGFFAGAGYDAVYLFAQAMTAVGYDTDKIEKYFHSMPNYEGTVGTYTFDQNGDSVGINPVFKKIVGGKLISL